VESTTPPKRQARSVQGCPKRRLAPPAIPETPATQQKYYYEYDENCLCIHTRTYPSIEYVTWGEMLEAATFPNCNPYNYY